MPLGAFGGRRDVMQGIAPSGSVYQAGTLSGNPVAVAAGLATLGLVQAAGFYPKLEAAARELCERLTESAQQHRVAFSAHQVGGMLGFYFRRMPPSSYAEVMECDRESFSRFFHAMLGNGVYLAPSPFETCFVSAAHGPAEVEKTVRSARRSFAEMAAVR